jgi:hypothetical protein
MDIKMLKKNLEIGVSLATIIGSIVTPVGLIYTVNQYINQQKTWREEKTLELYKTQLGEPLLANRISLNVFYDPVERKNYLSAIEKSKKDPKSLEKFTKTFSKKKEKQILTLTNFYEGIVNCVDTNICDKETTKSLFDKDIKEFVVLFGPFFCQLRQDLEDDTIALKLEEFYGSKKKLCPNSKNNRNIVAKKKEVRLFRFLHDIWYISDAK